MHLLRGFFDDLAGTLAAIWSSYGIGLALRSIRAGGDNTSAAEQQSRSAASDAMIVLTSALRVGEDEELLLAAFPPLMARIAAMESGRQAGKGSPREDLRSALGAARVEVDAVLSGSTMRMSDVLALAPGEIVLLNQQVTARLECRINGLPKFRGELIHSGKRPALL